MTATLALAAVTGAVLGTLYFGALWHSTRALVARGGYRSFALAAFVRLALVLGGLALFFGLGGDLPAFAAAALGFVAARMVLTRRAARTAGEG